MTILRRISAFFLLLTCCMPVVFTLFFLVRQQAIRHEMKEKLEEELLHTVVVPKNEVLWVKQNKEISIGDKLFDVKSFTIKNGEYVFTGLFDDEETALNNYFDKKTRQKNEQGYSVLSALVHLLLSVYPGNSDEVLVSENMPEAYSPLILQYISSPFINILTPPPQA